MTNLVNLPTEAEICEDASPGYAQSDLVEVVPAGAQRTPFCSPRYGASARVPSRHRCV